jgi:hypothetical protein
MKQLAIALALVAASGCVTVTYQRAGQRITPRTGQTLVFGRVRFSHDGQEFFPWNTDLFPTSAGTRIERHLWLLGLGRRAISAELHPDPDGSLAIWLASGDYALLGSIERSTTGAAPYEVVALVRVPAGAVAAYAGELMMHTETPPEGLSLSHGELGQASVLVLPIAIARATLEQRLGTLPQEPVLSPWCAGDFVPGFSDPHLARRGRELLDRGCDTNVSTDSSYP